MLQEQVVVDDDNWILQYVTFDSVLLKLFPSWKPSYYNTK